MHITTVSDMLRLQYGCKVLKLSLNAGCTCPNRDGTCGVGGCSFCSAGGSGEFASSFASIDTQIRQAKALTDKKFPVSLPADERRYIGYFQAFSNTYGPVSRLKPLFREVIERPEVVVLSIATRPDCLTDEMVELLSQLSRVKPVWVELGLQTIHEETARAFGRGYSLPVFEDAYRRLKQAGLTVITHVILGLPGEDREDMLATVRWLAGLRPVLDGIKLQMLQVLKGTRLEEQYRQEPFPVMTLEEYTDLVVACLQQLSPQTVIHRLTGDPPRRLLVAPTWCTDKKRVLNTLRRKIAQAARYQENPGVPAAQPAKGSPGTIE